jgi:5-methyltetrahydropteroyltriglutamate--homocysteine methyltransferase
MIGDSMPSRVFFVYPGLMRFVDCVGRDNLMAGSDCGFLQSPLAGRVHRSITWAKLRTLAEGAAIASKLAWG